jgi:tetratricopeptide (TPR) repeat protein
MVMLEDLESGELERRYQPEQLERVNEYVAILAKEGILPNEFQEKEALEEDIFDLMYGEASAFQLACYLESSDHDMIIPAVLSNYSRYNIVQCGKISHAWKKTKKFVKDHKKAIIIGAVVVVAVAAVAVAVVVASSAAATSAASAAAGAAGVAASSDSSYSGLIKSGSSESSSAESQTQVSSNEIPIFMSAIDEQISSFKEKLADENFFQTNNAGQGLSLEETGRAIGPLFAHDSFNHLNDHLSNYPQFSQEVQNIASQYNFAIPPGASDNPLGFGHNEIDRRFASDCGSIFSDPTREVNFNALSYQIKGERALSLGYYNQAVQDLGKAIEINPSDPIPYLERGVAHFKLGEYDRSLEDYKEFTSQTQAQRPNPPSVSEFSLGFAKGLPQGVYESGEGLFLFMGDFVKHPIQTSRHIVDSVSALVDLARKDEWGVVAEALSPEVYQLVTQWDTLPSEKRGELAGYAVGKHGAEILVPGALAKVASKSVKSVQELIAVCKNIQIAQETLVLETAAGIGNTAKVAEVVRNGQTMMALGEDIGLTAREMAHLKQAGKLESTINSGLEKLVSQSESEVLKAAINENRHVKMVRDYLDKPAKEVQKGINSYEKQIAFHKDKIANPKKHYPDWDKLDPRQREALVNKKWPAEILGYEEQKNVLQSILNERLSHE